MRKRLLIKFTYISLVAGLLSCASNSLFAQAITGDNTAVSSNNASGLSLTTLSPAQATDQFDDQDDQSDQSNQSNQVAISANQSLDPNALFPAPNALDAAAYDAVRDQAMPMTPYQINKLKRMLAATKEAVSAPAGIPPTPVTSSLMVNLAPGSTPPVILLQQDFISSLVFVDASGNPWPIEGIDIGDPNAFSVQWQSGSNTNVLLVQATTLFTYGNLAVKLKGLTTPVMLTLVPGQRSVDYRVDIHVQGQSPLASTPLGNDLPAPVSNVLLDVLNAIPPAGAKTLQVTGGSCSVTFNNCQAWYANDLLYVRIPMDILSPGWISKMQSSDGMHAYAMDKTPSLLVSDYGNTTTLKIEGY